jgi:leucine dehydrogenase
MKEEKHAQMLKDRGILYAPDYAINAGGLINVANEIEGYNRERAFKQAEEGIYDTLMAIYLRSEEDDVTTHMAASTVAKKRISDVSKLRNVYLPKKNVMGKRDNA